MLVRFGKMGSYYSLSDFLIVHGVKFGSQGEVVPNPLYSIIGFVHVPDGMTTMIFGSPANKGMICEYDSDGKWRDWWSLSTFPRTHTIHSYTASLKMSVMTDDIDNAFIANGDTGEYLWKGKNVRGSLAYIQDGLVFQLDGIKKGSDNENEWVDLIGGMRFVTTDGIRHSNCVEGIFECPDGTIAYHPFKATIEVAFEPLAEREKDVVFNTGTQQALCFGVHYASRYVSIAHCSNGDRVCFPPFDSSEDIYAMRMFSANKNRLLYDGKIISTFTSDDCWTPRGDHPMVNNDTAHNKVYSIRIYNRLLTEKEMRYNQQLDSKRFNLPLPESTVAHINLSLKNEK